MSGLAGGGAAGLVAGALAGAFGIGGGIVLVPLLALLVGLSQREAQGMTLAVLLLPVGLPALIAYRRVVHIRWRLAGAMVLGFLAGVGAGAVVAGWIPDRPLRIFFVLFLLAMAIHGWLHHGYRAGPSEERARPRRGDWNGLWVGAIGGVFAGLLGVGGGVVMVPLAAAGAGLDQREAQGATLAALLPPIGLPGVLIYAREGGFRWAVVAAVAISFGAGAFAGARLAARTQVAHLGRAFALFVLCVAVALGWKVLFP